MAGFYQRDDVAGIPRLAEEIVLQACRDYRDRICVRDADAFFRSGWYAELSQIPPDRILEKLRREWNRMKVELVMATPDPVETIAMRASLCYGKDTVRDPKALTRKLLENGHTSVFEHVVFTFKVSGISRACSHQLVRYRHCSFTQRSQRYCAETLEGHVVVPPSVQKNDNAWNAYQQALDAAYRAYAALIKCGIPKEDARYLLPNACETELFITLNLRELIHLCNERLCHHAQWEIRQVVGEMAKLVDPDLQYMLVPGCDNCKEKCKWQKQN